ncbi:class I SAM-dependent methyltransferase [Amycolatopsis nigrescens]|uniref:class I SAM-dependent methyltransferase n=1 Tax=Amycolatopsis nigrescens TaxID=381445 RepID=UPI0003691209|nr:class I SAM-dependent methyltransferase [Amycolatopsis nigrescens]
MSTPGEFAGEVAENYARYRRGYRADVIGHLAAEFGLGAGARVLDLGCGPGQLALPLAAVAGSVLGMDPSADMLALGLAAGRRTGTSNISWVLGADRDVPTLEPLLGRESVDLVTIGTAAHWMDTDVLFRNLVPLLRPGGGIAVIANSIPVWNQRSRWALALRELAAKWFGVRDFPSCGTSEAERERYRDELAAAGLSVSGEQLFDYTEQLDIEQVIGSFYSAAPLDRLNSDQRPSFDGEIKNALLAAEPAGLFTEFVPVRVLTGRRVL